MAAADVARSAGWTVALVEADVLGGTCSNRGCVPKKVLVAACELVDHARRAQGHGVAGEVRIDWAALQRRRRSIIDPLPASCRETSVEHPATAMAAADSTKTKRPVEERPPNLEARDAACGAIEMLNE